MKLHSLESDYATPPSHIYPENRWLFVTWHLHGSLPSSRFAPPSKATAGEAFVWMDRYLDAARTGPTFLSRMRSRSL